MKIRAVSCVYVCFVNLSFIHFLIYLLTKLVLPTHFPSNSKQTPWVWWAIIFSSKYTFISSERWCCRSPAIRSEGQQNGWGRWAQLPKIQEHKGFIVHCRALQVWDRRWTKGNGAKEYTWQSNTQMCNSGSNSDLEDSLWWGNQREHTRSILGCICFCGKPSV